MDDIFSGVSGSVGAKAESIIQRTLETMRRHLGMDAAYVSRFEGNVSVFRDVDAPGLSHLLAVDDRHSLDDVYCRHIVEGRLPELIPDTSVEPIAAGLAITHDAPIGAHISVPIRRADGELYGMFCCLSAAPRPELNDRDLGIFKAFASLVAKEIDAELAQRERFLAKEAPIRIALATTPPEIALQPIVALAGRVVIGFEALSRFALPPHRTPDLWFGDAAEVGLGVELECVAIRQALRVLDWLPADQSLSINVSPQTAVSPEFAAVLADAPMPRLVIEITEHAAVKDYEALSAHLRPHREFGARLAIDDAGAGFSSLQHIIKLQPDIIKLDYSLTHDIDSDPARQAMCAAMVMFARGTGAVIVSEGVETLAELETLTLLGVSRGQGYLLGRPVMAALMAQEHGAALRAA